MTYLQFHLCVQPAGADRAAVARATAVASPVHWKWIAVLCGIVFLVDDARGITGPCHRRIWDFDWRG